MPVGVNVNISNKPHTLSNMAAVQQPPNQPQASKNEKRQSWSEYGKEKYPGRDTLVESADHHMRYRGVLAGGRVYQLMLLGPKEFVTSQDAEKVLDSLEVTK